MLLSGLSHVINIHMYTSKDGPILFRGDNKTLENKTLKPFSPPVREKVTIISTGMIYKKFKCKIAQTEATWAFDITNWFIDNFWSNLRQGRVPSVHHVSTPIHIPILRATTNLDSITSHYTTGASPRIITQSSRRFLPRGTAHDARSIQVCCRIRRLAAYRARLGLEALARMSPGGWRA